MDFRQTNIPGLLHVRLEPFHDDRGYFARSYCEKTFRDNGLNTHWPQCNLSHNRQIGVLRGLHFQHPPGSEIKWVRIARGAAFVAVIDLRPHSPAFKTLEFFHLKESDPASLYIPGGLAYGFQTLAPDTDIHYQMSVDYQPELAGGIRWNDPDLHIDWPMPGPILSERDQNLPTLQEFLSQQSIQSAWTDLPLE